MAKRIVNKAERNAERCDAKETGYRLFEDSQNGKTFDRLMPLIVSEQNIILAYRNICKNSGSKTPGTDGKTIVAIQSLPIESVIKTVRNKLNYYQPKKVRRVEIPKDNGKTRPLGIPSIWDRLTQSASYRYWSRFVKRNSTSGTMASDHTGQRRMQSHSAIKWRSCRTCIL